MLLLKCKLSFGINRDPVVFLNEHVNMFSTAVQTLFDLTEPVFMVNANTRISSEQF
jgi:hypothetical protein